MGKGTHLVTGLALLVLGILLLSPVVRALVTLLGWALILAGVALLVTSAFRRMARRR